MTKERGPQHLRAIHKADQENARLAEQRASSPDNMTASERAMHNVAKPPKVMRVKLLEIARLCRKVGLRADVHGLLVTISNESQAIVCVRDKDGEGEEITVSGKSRGSQFGPSASALKIARRVCCIIMRD